MGDVKPLDGKTVAPVVITGGKSIFASDSYGNRKVRDTSRGKERYPFGATDIFVRTVTLS